MMPDHIFQIQPYRQFVLNAGTFEITHTLMTKQSSGDVSEFISTFSADNPAVRITSTSGALNGTKSTFVSQQNCLEGRLIKRSHSEKRKKDVVVMVQNAL